jgi:hypothetical protein
MGETTIDYDGLIAAAIGNLNNNTAALRHALYNHAEKALICELRKIDPPLLESDIIRERLLFHRAVESRDGVCVARYHSRIDIQNAARAQES